MTLRAPLATLLCTAALALPCAHAHAHQPAPGSHQFGVIGNSFANGGSEMQLEQALAATGDPGIAFVVATGIKGVTEPCSDTLYARRREMFENARRPIVVLPSANDWSDCKSWDGRPVAIERLNRLRELFYPEPESLGRRTLTLSRLSSSAKFRSYAENAQWQIGKVLYATVNLPANNNHYRPEAGRNSEYEDRSVANRFWLNRLFSLARRKKLDAVVLFSEGDVKALNEESGLMALLGRRDQRQDGFAATRKQIGALAQKFNGKVLLIDTAPLPNGADPAIEWRANLGHVSAGSGTLHVRVAPGSGDLFNLERP